MRRCCVCAACLVPKKGLLMSNLSRRVLVQTAALVPIQAGRGTAQNSTVKIGLIGAGSRGTYTSRTVAKDPRAKIVAICDGFDEQIENAKAKIPAPDPKPYKK